MAETDGTIHENTHRRMDKPGKKPLLSVVLAEHPQAHGRTRPQFRRVGASLRAWTGEIPEFMRSTDLRRIFTRVGRLRVRPPNTVTYKAHPCARGQAAAYCPRRGRQIGAPLRAGTDFIFGNDNCVDDRRVLARVDRLRERRTRVAPGGVHPCACGQTGARGHKICRCPCAGKRQRTASPERVPVRKRGLRADGRPHPPVLSGETPAMSPAGSGARRFPDSSPARDGCPGIAPAKSARKRRKICRSTAPPPPRRGASSGTARPRER